MPSPLQKGDALELAVHAIESAILRSSPALHENTFTIESKKHMVVVGVRHEIDVYVQVDLGKGYKATFIFECKNWEAAVGKNHIIIFSEKIDAVQAQEGFFVARSFTKDAEAQAAKDPRITLLTATEHNAAETPVPFDMHFVLEEQANAEVELIERGESSSRRHEPIQIQEARAVLNGADLSLDKYVREWMPEVYDECTRTFPSGTLGEGIYERVQESQRHFDEGELRLNDKDIASVNLRATFALRVVRPPVVSHFEVATRGRALSLAPVSIGGTTIRAGFVAE